MSYKFIQYRVEDGKAYITINRPEVLNALHPAASEEMLSAFTDFRDNPETVLAIITSIGDRSFCAGNDLKYHAQNVARGEPYPDANKVPFGGITSNFTCWKPIIAAVNGYAVGGGLELAMACDIIVASDHAMVGLPEPRVGLVGIAGGVQRLARQIPFRIAMGMMVTGTLMSASDGYKWGLINEVVPKEKLKKTVEKWASEIIKCAPLSVRATKQMATEGASMDLETAISHKYQEFDRAVFSDDYVEGPKAFAEKRPPKWTAR